MKNINSFLKKILPLKYKSKYSTIDGKKYTITWNMWFGKVFNTRHCEV